MQKIIPKEYLFIFIACLILFFPFLGAVHLFDWDEINFAECAREMLLSKNYWTVQIGFEPFHEKPPLFIWMQALSMKIFGVNEWAARFPNAVCSIATLSFLFYIGKKIHTKHFAIAWVVIYLGSFLPHFYFKTGIMDPWFNLFILIALYALFKGLETKSWIRIIWGGFSLGLAMLVKGPVAILIISLCLFVYWLHIFFQTKTFQSIFKQIPRVFSFFLVALIPFLIWACISIWQHGTALFFDFIEYQIRLFSTQDAGHGGFLGYHIVVLLLGCMPASFFMIKSLFQKSEHPFALWMKILFWVVLILFSIVQSKIVHYSSLCYFPITYLAALQIEKYLDRKEKMPFILSKIYAGLGILIGLLLIAVSFLHHHIEGFKTFFDKDEFARANLQAKANWHGWEWIIGVLYIAFIVYAIWISNRNIKRHLLFLFLSMLFLVQGIFYGFINKVEAYSQKANIDFFESLQNKDVYVSTYAYKSYAHLFYTKAKPENVLHPFWQSAIEIYKTDSQNKALYLSVKNTKANEVEALGLQKLYEKNGFVFWKKEPLASNH
ncbi:MAG: glycosyltransferase family 39 protein [Chitinophagaceae bacterium]